MSNFTYIVEGKSSNNLAGVIGTFSSYNDAKAFMTIYYNEAVWGDRYLYKWERFLIYNGQPNGEIPLTDNVVNQTIFSADYKTSKLLLINNSKS